MLGFDFPSCPDTRSRGLLVGSRCGRDALWGCYGIRPEGVKMIYLSMDRGYVISYGSLVS